MSPAALRFDPISYVERLKERRPEDISLLVIHCTELPDLATARAYGERILYPQEGTGACGHYYVERDGRVEEWVPPVRVAHHVRGYNEHSIGIELINSGRYPDWYDSSHQTMTEPYPAAQISALLVLIRGLQHEYPSLRFISGHENLDRNMVPATDDPAQLVYRKRDPGPLFPWERVLRETRLEFRNA